VVRTEKVRMRPAGNEAGELSEPSGASCDGGFFVSDTLVDLAPRCNRRSGVRLRAGGVW
jgi:hypothetical protein